MENAILLAYAALAGLFASFGLWRALLQRTKTSPQHRHDEVAVNEVREPAPEITLEMIARGDIDDRLRDLYEQRASGWDMQWWPEGGSHGSLIGQERMALKLAAERRMHELAERDEERQRLELAAEQRMHELAERDEEYLRLKQAVAALGGSATTTPQDETASGDGDNEDKVDSTD